MTRDGFQSRNISNGSIIKTHRFVVVVKHSNIFVPDCGCEMFSNIFRFSFFALLCISLCLFQSMLISISKALAESGLLTLITSNLIPFFSHWIQFLKSYFRWNQSIDLEKWGRSSQNLFYWCKMRQPQINLNVKLRRWVVQVMCKTGVFFPIHRRSIITILSYIFLKNCWMNGKFVHFSQNWHLFHWKPTKKSLQFSFFKNWRPNKNNHHPKLDHWLFGHMIAWIGVKCWLLLFELNNHKQ